MPYLTKEILCNVYRDSHTQKSWELLPTFFFFNQTFPWVQSQKEVRGTGSVLTISIKTETKTITYMLKKLSKNFANLFISRRNSDSGFMLRSTPTFSAWQHLVLCVTRHGSSSEQSLQSAKINISKGLWNLMACAVWAVTVGRVPGLVGEPLSSPCSFLVTLQKQGETASLAVKFCFQVWPCPPCSQ